jgi:hypothetical protein
MFETSPVISTASGNMQENEGRVFYYFQSFLEHQVNTGSGVMLCHKRRSLRSRNAITRHGAPVPYVIFIGRTCSMKPVAEKKKQKKNMVRFLYLAFGRIQKQFMFVKFYKRTELFWKCIQCQI